MASPEEQSAKKPRLSNDSLLQKSTWWASEKIRLKARHVRSTAAFKGFTREQCQQSAFHLLRAEHQVEHKEKIERQLERDFFSIEGLTCSQCYQAFSSALHLEKHVSFCVYSGSPVKTVDSLLMKDGNIFKDPSSGMMMCPWCPLLCLNGSLLQKHVGSCREARRRKTQKDTLEKFPCPECPSQFANLQNLLLHLQSHYVSDIVCSSCEKEFLSTKAFCNHLILCSGVTVYKCCDCSKICKDVSQLRRHLGQCKKLTQCLKCAKSVIQRRSSLAHMSLHLYSEWAKLGLKLTNGILYRVSKGTDQFERVNMESSPCNTSIASPSTETLEASHKQSFNLSPTKAADLLPARSEERSLQKVQPGLNLDKNSTTALKSPNHNDLSTSTEHCSSTSDDEDCDNISITVDNWSCDDTALSADEDFSALQNKSLEITDDSDNVEHAESEKLVNSNSANSEVRSNAHEIHVKATCDTHGELKNSVFEVLDPLDVISATSCDDNFVAQNGGSFDSSLAQKNNTSHLFTPAVNDSVDGENELTLTVVNVEGGANLFDWDDDCNTNNEEGCGQEESTESLMRFTPCSNLPILQTADGHDSHLNADGNDGNEDGDSGIDATEDQDSNKDKTEDFYADNEFGLPDKTAFHPASRKLLTTAVQTDALIRSCDPVVSVPEEILKSNANIESSQIFKCNASIESSQIFISSSHCDNEIVLGCPAEENCKSKKGYDVLREHSYPIPAGQILPWFKRPKNKKESKTSSAQSLGVMKKQESLFKTKKKTKSANQSCLETINQADSFVHEKKPNGCKTLSNFMYVSESVKSLSNENASPINVNCSTNIAKSQNGLSVSQSPVSSQRAEKAKHPEDSEVSAWDSQPSAFKILFSDLLPPISLDHPVAIDTGNIVLNEHTTENPFKAATPVTEMVNSISCFDTSKFACFGTTSGKESLPTLSSESSTASDSFETSPTSSNNHLSCSSKTLVAVPKDNVQIVNPAKEMPHNPFVLFISNPSHIIKKSVPRYLLPKQSDEAGNEEQYNKARILSASSFLISSGAGMSGNVKTREKMVRKEQSMLSHGFKQMASVRLSAEETLKDQVHSNLRVLDCNPQPLNSKENQTRVSAVAVKESSTREALCSSASESSGSVNTLMFIVSSDGTLLPHPNFNSLELNDSTASSKENLPPPCLLEGIPLTESCVVDSSMVKRMEFSRELPSEGNSSVSVAKEHEKPEINMVVPASIITSDKENTECATENANEVDMCLPVNPDLALLNQSVPKDSTCSNSTEFTVECKVEKLKLNVLENDTPQESVALPEIKEKECSAHEAASSDPPCQSLPSSLNSVCDSVEPSKHCYLDSMSSNVADATKTTNGSNMGKPFEICAMELCSDTSSVEDVNERKPKSCASVDKEERSNTERHACGLSNEETKVHVDVDGNDKLSDHSLSSAPIDANLAEVSSSNNECSNLEKSAIDEMLPKNLIISNMNVTDNKPTCKTSSRKKKLFPQFGTHHMPCRKLMSEMTQFRRSKPGRNGMMKCKDVSFFCGYCIQWFYSSVDLKHHVCIKLLIQDKFTSEDFDRLFEENDHKEINEKESKQDALCTDKKELNTTPLCVGMSPLEVFYRMRLQKEKKFICEKCQMKFKSFSALHDHKSIVHTEKSTFACHVCGKEFPRIQMLAVHFAKSHRINKQTAEKDPLKCLVADSPKTSIISEEPLNNELKGKEKITRNSSFLKKNIPVKVQTEDPVSEDDSGRCKICLKTFSAKGALKSHVNQAHGPVYKCPICLRRFTYLSTMKIHYIKHFTSPNPEGAKTLMRTPVEGIANISLPGEKEEVPFNNITCEKDGHTMLFEKVENIAPLKGKEDIENLVTSVKPDGPQPLVESFSQSHIENNCVSRQSEDLPKAAEETTKFVQKEVDLRIDSTKSEVGGGVVTDGPNTNNQMAFNTNSLSPNQDKKRKKSKWVIVKDPLSDEVISPEVQKVNQKVRSSCSSSFESDTPKLKISLSKVKKARHKCQDCDKRFRKQHHLALHRLEEHERDRFMCPMCNVDQGDSLKFQAHFVLCEGKASGKPNEEKKGPAKESLSVTASSLHSDEPPEPCREKEIMKETDAKEVSRVHNYNGNAEKVSQVSEVNVEQTETEDVPKVQSKVEPAVTEPNSTSIVSSEDQTSTSTECNVANSSGEGCQDRRKTRFQAFSNTLRQKQTSSRVSRKRVSRKGIWKCSECQIQFSAKGYLDRHNIKTHGAPCKFQCPLCRKIFTDLRCLKFHHKTKHSKKKWETPNSPPSAQVTENSQQSVAACTELLKADEVGTSSGPNEEQETKILSNTSESVSSSSGLEMKQVTSASSAAKNLSRPVKKRAVRTCKYCNKPFWRGVDLQKHYKMKHNNGAVSKSRRSISVADQPKIALETMADSEEGPKKETGVTSSQGCSSGAISGVLQPYELEGNSEVKPKQSNGEDVTCADGANSFKCTNCPSSYRTSASLKRHCIVAHGVPADHYCKICGKGFSHERSLKSHMMTHSRGVYKSKRLEKSMKQSSDPLSGDEQNLEEYPNPEGVFKESYSDADTRYASEEKSCPAPTPLKPADLEGVDSHSSKRIDSGVIFDEYVMQKDSGMETAPPYADPCISAFSDVGTLNCTAPGMEYHDQMNQANEQTHSAVSPVSNTLPALLEQPPVALPNNVSSFQYTAAPTPNVYLPQPAVYPMYAPPASVPWAPPLQEMSAFNACSVCGMCLSSWQALQEHYFSAHAPPPPPPSSVFSVPAPTAPPPFASPWQQQQWPGHGPGQGPGQGHGPGQMPDDGAPSFQELSSHNAVHCSMCGAPFYTLQALQEHHASHMMVPGRTLPLPYNGFY